MNSSCQKNHCTVHMQCTVSVTIPEVHRIPVLDGEAFLTPTPSKLQPTCNSADYSCNMMLISILCGCLCATSILQYVCGILL